MGHTTKLKGCQALVPRKIDQAGAFLSYSLPHFYERDTLMCNKRNAPNGSENMHYSLQFNAKNHHVEMRTNNSFMSLGLVMENRGPNAALDFNKVTIRPVK
jgi:hypothetical protein